MNFYQIWFAGYISPTHFSKELQGKPAPLWGFWAVMLRAALISLLMYLPLYLNRVVPPTASYLSFISTEGYFGALVWLTPLVLLAEWLLGGALTHVILRLLKKPSDIDQILNITGMVSLVIGIVIFTWDWIWIFFGGMDQYLWGISHLIIDFWAIAITAISFKRILGVHYRLGVLLGILMIAAGLPFAIMFMRAPM